MLQLKHIVKDYVAGDTTVKALKGVSVDFRQSEFVSILGPSGCGKTTLLNIIGGLDRYTSGDLIINNKSTKQFKDGDWDTYRNHSIGFVFQSYNLISHLSIVGNVELALSISGVTRKERRKRALNALKEVGLKDQANKKPNQLSGGQMQRVAIARALVNDPDIILADEPTGALDSKTSVQVMNILKKISSNKLIIMVTHNSSLAEEYSNRIISMLDGKITSDTNPYSYEKDNEAIKTETLKTEKLGTEKLENNQTNEKTKKSKIKKSAMGYGTALSLSGKNLLSKKGRTFMTSFAGSIGIIGIALVLAISNGFSLYINKIQSDTLSGYPIAISTVAVDLNTITSGSLADNNKPEEFPDSNQIEVTEPSTNFISFSHYNFISPDFVEYVKDYEENDNNKTINDISYSYTSPLNILTKYGDSVKSVQTTITNSAITGSTSASFYEGLKNDDFIKSQYDVLYGTYPQDKFEVALVIPSTNQVQKRMLDNLGIEYETTNTGYSNIDFSSIVGENGKEYKVVLNNDYYGTSDFRWTTQNVSGSNDKPTDEDLKSLYNNENNITLKVTAILRVKPETALSVYSTGIVYRPELTEYLNNIEKNSEIVKAQLNDDKNLIVPYVMKVSELNIDQTFTSVAVMKAFVKNFYNIELSTQQVHEYALQGLCASSIPTSIKIYPKDFEGKDAITSYLSDWNNTEKGQTNKIVYSDATQMLSSTMGEMVNIISYVLIAFASVSLIVSSVMIGVLTYASVIERTKEIGVLRSIGARKKDISRVFNSETLIIGFVAGLIGIIVTYALCPIINLIIFKIAGDAITTNIAVLNPLHALILVIISTLLTLISGLIPAKIAAKKDPVKALRTE